MSISERFRELWRRVRFAGGWQVRMLLLTAMLLGGFLSFYQFGASAESSTETSAESSTETSAESLTEKYIQCHMRIFPSRCYGCKIPDSSVGGTNTEDTKKRADYGYSTDLQSLDFPKHVKITRLPINNTGHEEPTLIYNEGSPQNGAEVTVGWAYDSQGENCHYWADKVRKEDFDSVGGYYYFIEFINGDYFVGQQGVGACVKFDKNFKGSNYTDNNGDVVKWIYNNNVCLIKKSYTPAFKYEDQFGNTLYTSNSSDKGYTPDHYCCYSSYSVPSVQNVFTYDNELYVTLDIPPIDYLFYPQLARINGKYCESGGTVDIALKQLANNPTMTFVTGLDYDYKGTYYRGNYYYIDPGEDLDDPAKSLFTNENFFNLRTDNTNVFCKKYKEGNTAGRNDHGWVVYTFNKDSKDPMFDTETGCFKKGVHLEFKSITRAITFSKDSVNTTGVTSSTDPSDDTLFLTTTSGSDGPEIKINSVDYTKFKSTFEYDDNTLPGDSVTITAAENDDNTSQEDSVPSTATKYDVIYGDDKKWYHYWTIQDLQAANLDDSTTLIDAVKGVKYTFTPKDGYAIDSGGHGIKMWENYSFKTDATSYPTSIRNGIMTFALNLGSVYEDTYADSTFTIVGVRRQITPKFTTTSEAVGDSVTITVDDNEPLSFAGKTVEFGQLLLDENRETLNVTLKIKDGDWRRFQTNSLEDYLKCDNYSLHDIARDGEGKNVSFKLDHAEFDSGTITIDPNILQNTVFVDSARGNTFTNKVFSENYTLTAKKLTDSTTEPSETPETETSETSDTYTSKKWSEAIHDDNNPDHSWVIYLDSDTSADITITGDTHTYYGFARSSGVTYTDGTNTAGTKITPSLERIYGLSGKDRYNQMKFQLTDLTDSPDKQTLTVSGLSYLLYTNTFQYYENGKDISKYLDITCGDIDYHPRYDQDAKNYVQNWTHVSPANFDQYTVNLKDGYAIGSDFKVTDEGTEITPTVPSAKSCSFKLDCKSTEPLSDHNVILGPVKSRYGLIFTSDGDDITKYVTVSCDSTTLDWTQENYHLIDTTLDSPIEIKLTLTDPRRKFVNDSNILDNSISIANNSNSTVAAYGITSNRISDTELILTLAHTETDGCTITVGADIVEWRTTNVKINVDMNDVDSGHLADCKFKCEGVELTLDPASDGGDLIYTTTLENQPLNKLKFKVVCLEPENGMKFEDNSVVTATWGENRISEINVTTMSDMSLQTNAITCSIDVSALTGSYSNTIVFDIKGLHSAYCDVIFDLCQNIVLYDSGGERLYKGGEFASSVYTDKVIYGKTGATYTILYSDYSKTFGLSKIKIWKQSESDAGSTGETETPSGSSGADTGATGSQLELYNGETGVSSDDVTVKLVSFNKVQITLPTIDNEITISCTDPGDKSPMVSFASIEGVQYGIWDDDSNSVEWFNSKRKSIDYGAENFKFYVKALGGYDITSLNILSNGGVLNGDDDENYSDAKFFTVEGPITSNISITGSIGAQQCTVTFNAQGNLKPTSAGDAPIIGYYYNGLKLTPNKNNECTVVVLYGSTVGFDVELPEGYTQSPDMAVYCKGDSAALKKIDGQYLISNITEDKNVTVENISLNEYPITFTSSDKVEFYGCDNNKSTSESPTTTVEHGGNCQFSIKSKEGYSLDDMVVVAKYSNGEMVDVVKLSSSEHCYGISNITQACTISVENISDMEYTVTLEPVDGIIYQNDVGNVITDKVAVKYGNNFEFYVVLDDAYDDSKDNIYVQVTKGDSYVDPPRKLAVGRYIVQNITHDISLKIGNVTKNSYVVSLMDEEGIDYYDSKGKVITGENDVEHGADFKFKVSLYPAYAGSDIAVMLGDTAMVADSSGFYTVSNVTESKTVTVTGIEESDASELVNSISSLPDSIRNLGDVDDVIELTKIYESLSDDEKALITNIDKLTKLQEEAKQYNHISNGVTVDGVEWYIKLYANPITDDTDACGRIYKNLTSEYILSLYDVYLWNTLTDTRYTLPEGQSVVINLPTPDMQYFDNPTAVHEKSSSKLEFLILSVNGDTSSFTTDSFSAMGIVANRNSTPGRSSLLDAVDANLDELSNFAAAAFGNSSTTVTNTSFDDSDSGSSISGSTTDGDITSDNMSGNIDEKFRSRQNKVTAAGSALRLILVLMILILLSVVLYLYYKRKKKNKEKSSVK